MKKFFMFIVVVMACVINANAQYVNTMDKYEMNKYFAEEEYKLSLLPEYKRAINKRNTGIGLFFVGGTLQVIGSISAYNAYVEAWSNVKTVPEGTKCSVNADMTAGCITAILGSVMEIIGACKWAKGCVELRDIKIVYGINNNKFVVAF